MLPGKPPSSTSAGEELEAVQEGRGERGAGGDALHGRLKLPRRRGHIRPANPSLNPGPRLDAQRPPAPASWRPTTPAPASWRPTTPASWRPTTPASWRPPTPAPASWRPAMHAASSDTCQDPRCPCRHHAVPAAVRARTFMPRTRVIARSGRSTRTVRTAVMLPELRRARGECVYDQGEGWVQGQVWYGRGGCGEGNRVDWPPSCYRPAMQRVNHPARQPPSRPATQPASRPPPLHSREDVHVAQPHHHEVQHVPTWKPGRVGGTAGSRGGGRGGCGGHVEPV